MRKISFLALIFLSVFSHSIYASKNVIAVTENTQCKYSADDALAAVDGFVSVKIITVSQEKTRKILTVLLHNPKNSDKNSIDAKILLLTDSRLPGKQLILMFDIFSSSQEIFFKREIIDTKE